jgi:hypothetical protein
VIGSTSSLEVIEALGLVFCDTALAISVKVSEIVASVSITSLAE